MNKVSIFTDGSCLGNPGPGGYGCVLVAGENRMEISSGYLQTTNNRMELLAAIVALETLRHPCEVTLTSDSNYVRQGITSWIHGWKRNGWKTANKGSVKNADLWKRLDAVASQHQITWEWVKGHSGHPENERCDQLARDAASFPDEHKHADEGYTNVNT